MDFAPSPETRRTRDRYRAFGRQEVLPYDTTPESFDEHDNLREELLDRDGLLDAADDRERHAHAWARAHS